MKNDQTNKNNVEPVKIKLALHHALCSYHFQLENKHLGEPPIESLMKHIGMPLNPKASTYEFEANYVILTNYSYILNNSSILDWV